MKFVIGCTIVSELDVGDNCSMGVSHVDTDAGDCGTLSFGTREKLELRCLCCTCCSFLLSSFFSISFEIWLRLEKLMGLDIFCDVKCDKDVVVFLVLDVARLGVHGSS